MINKNISAVEQLTEHAEETPRRLWKDVLMNYDKAICSESRKALAN